MCFDHAVLEVLSTYETNEPKKDYITKEAVHLPLFIRIYVQIFVCFCQFFKVYL